MSQREGGGAGAGAGAGAGTKRKRGHDDRGRKSRRLSWQHVAMESIKTEDDIETVRALQRDLEKLNALAHKRIARLERRAQRAADAAGLSYSGRGALECAYCRNTFARDPRGEYGGICFECRAAVCADCGTYCSNGNEEPGMMIFCPNRPRPHDEDAHGWNDPNGKPKKAWYCHGCGDGIECQHCGMDACGRSCTKTCTNCREDVCERCMSIEAAEEWCIACMDEPGLLRRRR